MKKDHFKSINECICSLFESHEMTTKCMNHIKILVHMSMLSGHMMSIYELIEFTNIQLKDYMEDIKKIISPY